MDAVLLTSARDLLSGRVQLLRAAKGDRFQALAAGNELERLSRLVPGWSWSRAAIIARNWRYLHPVQDCCKAQGIPVQLRRIEALTVAGVPAIRHFPARPARPDADHR